MKETRRITLTRRRALGLLAALSCAGAARAAEAPPVRVRDAEGKEHEPLAGKDRRATVLFFVGHECPISNRYAPEVNRIIADFAPKGMACYVVYVDPGLSPADAAKHARDYGYRCPALLDVRHELVKKAGATITPEVAVLAPDGQVLYRGRIDDRYVDLGRARQQPTVRDLRAALNAVLNGKPVPQRFTRAVGCFIPALD